MNRTASIALFAGLLVILSPSLANAQAISTTSKTAFTGGTTDLGAYGFHPLPYTVNGTALSGTGSGNVLVNGLGLSFEGYPNTYDTITFAVAAPVNGIGFDFNTSFNNSGDYLYSVSLSNGDSWTSGTSASNDVSSVGFMGFTDATPFTSASVTFEFTSQYSSDVMTDFVVAPAASVPEPSSIAMASVAGLFVCAAAWRRRRQAKAARVC